MNKNHSITLRIPVFRSLRERVFEGTLRFVIPFVIVLVAKIAGAVWLYSQLSHPVLHKGFLSWGNFFDIFVNWDTVFFQQNLTYQPYPDYLHAAYAFLPGYSIVIWALYTLTGNFAASVVLPALVFGVAWIPFFQAVAEHYMSRTEAMGCTLITAFFPIVFLFTTVAYSEPLFLFACVASWYFYNKEKPLYACLMAAVVAITRIYGIFLAIPMFLDLLLRRRWKELPYTLIPAFALLGWFYFCFLKTGDWLASHTAGSAFFAPGLEWLTGRMVPLVLKGAYMPFNPTDMTFIAVIGLLAFLCWKFDWRLSVYSIITFVGIIAASSYTPSFPRFFSFIFPIWLHARTKNLIAIAVICTFFYINAMMAWYQFHLGVV